MKVFLLGALSFFLGCIPTAFWVGRSHKLDIRKVGSGNVGATNAFRVLGKKWGIFVFVVDFLKGLLPVLAAQWVLSLGWAGYAHAAIVAGACSIAGHVFNPFLGFKGGKGVATSAGVLCGLFPILFLIATAVWIAGFLWRRVVSIASLLSGIPLIVFCLSPQAAREERFFLITLFLFISWTHCDNIKRLLSGKEKSIVNR